MTKVQFQTPVTPFSVLQNSLTNVDASLNPCHFRSRRLRGNISLLNNLLENAMRAVDMQNSNAN
ncbi:MAG: hypothetical protein DWQ34_19590 [Planctomycetota bacterium]|nr:MAG: hypothetical protein DWQ29_14840 [Planctomycetota bacterium]REJ89461.1 MAG: hypothetical protein DWQ34_19590 [Planctomycetota bacterium]REK39598.1 MAG: hypothetical protein DWQ45_01615 [Planctomycetota bacterium]